MEQNDEETLLTSIDAYIENGRRRLLIPALSLAIVNEERVLHMRGFGQARPGSGTPTPQTLYFIGSLTKSFTALAVMQLVEAGKVDLDAPVQLYLPWFRLADSDAAAALAIRHLLNQTSGLPISVGEINLANFDSHPDATERQALALANLAPSRPVGRAFEYCNTNYNLLGLVVEAASGYRYESYLRRNILDPLGMTHTFTPKELKRKEDLAMGHRYWFATPVASPDMPIPHGSLPGGLLISCTEDLATYLRTIMNGGRLGDVQILSRAGIEEMEREVADFFAMGQYLGHYGMGWFIGTIGTEKVIWHGGTMPDYYSYMAFFPGQKKGLIMLMNACHHWMNPVLTEFCIGAAALLAGEQTKPVPFVSLFPWLLRGLALVPVVQISDVATSWQRIAGWRRHPATLTTHKRTWLRQIFLPLFLNLLPAVLLWPLLGKRRGYLKLFQPDLTLIGMTSGTFAIVWGFLRTMISLRTLSRSWSNKTI